MSNDSPRLIGVVNLSPESDVPGSVATDKEAVLSRSRHLAAQGAHVIEIGARSINPRSAPVDEETERRRLLPNLRLLKSKGFRVGVETWSESTAMMAVDEGVEVINFSAGAPAPRLYERAGRDRVWLILFYLPYDDPYVMRRSAKIRYGRSDILDTLRHRVALARERGCDRLIVDPNAGVFHRDVGDHEKILLQLQAIDCVAPLKAMDLPVMLYTPRKSNASARTIMAALIAREKVDYIRCHEPGMVRNLLDASVEWR